MNQNFTAAAEAIEQAKHQAIGYAAVAVGILLVLALVVWAIGEGKRDPRRVVLPSNF